MKQEKANKRYEEKGIINIPQYKKIWYSITKFEKYPEMATEGVGRAILYLTQLMLIFAIIVAIGMVYNFNKIFKQGIDYLDKNISQLSYQNGELSVNLLNENKIKTDIGTLIFDTNNIDDTKIQEYQKSISSGQMGIIWLKDHVIVQLDGNAIKYYYKSILDGFDIKEFNKESLLQYLKNTMDSPQIYFSYGITMMIYIFIVYIISTLIDVLMLSVFGLLTTIIAKIKMRYRAVFNMSVYAITLSTTLQLIYTFINLFIDFNVKYFDLMYTAIAYICLTAAIFMIKSDVIKQQIELMKVIQIKKQEQEQNQQEKENKPEEKKKEDKKDEKEDKENKDEEKHKEKDKGIESDAEGQGSNA